MCERHWQVIVHGDDQMPIVFRQFEPVEPAHVVPEGRPDDHVAVRVRFANDRERFGEQRVPVRIERAIRLIEYFEDHLG